MKEIISLSHLINIHGKGLTIYRKINDEEPVEFDIMNHTLHTLNWEIDLHRLLYKPIN